MSIEFIRTISDGKKIYGILHLPRNPSPPFVVASHGLFSSKESEKFVAIGEFFSAQGIALIRYDHQGCGESEGDLSATTASSRASRSATSARASTVWRSGTSRTKARRPLRSPSSRSRIWRRSRAASGP